MVWKELEKQESRRAGSATKIPSGSGEQMSARDALVAAVFGDGPPGHDIQVLASADVHWHRIAGDLAGRCRPTRVTGGRLVIECDHAVFAQELQFSAPGILKQVQELPGGSVITALQIRNRASENRANQP